MAYEYGKKMVYSLKDSVNNAIVIYRSAAYAVYAAYAAYAASAAYAAAYAAYTAAVYASQGMTHLMDCSHQCSAHGARSDLTRPLDCVGGWC